MCDTVCVAHRDGMLFGKNSDRPVAEVQLVEAHGPRPAGGTLRTQYLALADEGSCRLVGARPDWLWGFEHGVNEHGVAIGNEALFTARDPAAEPDALIGMDLVRLGLERARTADEALDLITDLLERHGQGGMADQHYDLRYFSSFLLADARGGWALETSGTTWAARPVGRGWSISNRICLGTDWSRASRDVAPGADFDAYRDTSSTGTADCRLAATRALASRPDEVGPRDVVATLRHHGERPWGAPGADPGDVSPLPPAQSDGDGTGWSVCMHLRDFETTTSSMVALLPRDAEAPVRIWAAVGTPCVSIYAPLFLPGPVPVELGLEATWGRVAALRAAVEREDDALVAVRAVLGPVESELWDEADAVVDDDAARTAFSATLWPRIDAALALAATAVA
ncbi:MAG: hypothetical protein MUF83_06985 [Acidimicrobiales bacterium]|jgi:secernin|nr:hypothetical protein [Acidimicrobiales bacterium]